MNRSHAAPGQRVELDVTVAFSSAAGAEAAQQSDRFHVHLLRGFDFSVVERAMRKPSPGDWWSLGGAEAIEVGQVAVSVPDANFGMATAAFTVPELPPGTYHLMLCDTACTEPLADVIPTEGFTVVADPATARMAERVDRLERRSRDQADQLAVADRELSASVSSPANEGGSSPRATPWAYAGWLVAGALAGALALLVLRRNGQTFSGTSRRELPAGGRDRVSSASG